MAKRKISSKKVSSSKKKFSLKSIIVVCLTLIIVATGIVYFAYPRDFWRVIRKIEHVFYTSPVKFPENDIVGIDISLYQGNIKWDKVQFKIDPINGTLTVDENAKSRKIDFVIAKATEGITIKDSKYEVNKKGAESQKILFGAYHYFSVTSDPSQQALHFIKTAKLKAGNILPIIDVEYQGRLSKEELRKRVLIWLKEVEKHYGRKPIIYTYANFHDDIFGTKEFKDYYFWEAHYGVSQPRHDCKFWQFTENGIVYGINGYVDIDIFLGSAREMKRVILQ